MLEEVNEPIEVVAVFQGNKFEPYKFLWNGREIKIKQVNLAYSNWDGRSKIYYFAVSDNNNYFKLKFDTDKLTWTLLETYVE